MDSNEKKRRFEEIYQKEADSVFRYAFLRVSNREEALDIAQDSFTRLWQAFGKEMEIENMRSFLFTIARNRVIDWYRKKKSLSLESMMEIEDEKFFEIADDNAHKDIEIGAETSLVLKAINKLSRQHREIVYLRFVEDLQPREIAQILNITPNAASIRIGRGMEELRKNLNIE